MRITIIGLLTQHEKKLAPLEKIMNWKVSCLIACLSLSTSLVACSSAPESTNPSPSPDASAPGEAMKGDAMKGDAMKGGAMKGDAMKKAPKPSQP